MKAQIADYCLVLYFSVQCFNMPSGDFVEDAALQANLWLNKIHHFISIRQDYGEQCQMTMSKLNLYSAFS